MEPQQEFRPGRAVEQPQPNDQAIKDAAAVAKRLWEDSNRAAQATPRNDLPPAPQNNLPDTRIVPQAAAPHGDGAETRLLVKTDLPTIAGFATLGAMYAKPLYTQVPAPYLEAAAKGHLAKRGLFSPAAAYGL